MPIYSKKKKKKKKKKNLKHLLLQDKEIFEPESWYIALGLKTYQVCSNDNPRLNTDLLTAMSNLRPYAFVGENIEIYIFSQNGLKTNG